MSSDYLELGWDGPSSSTRPLLKPAKAPVRDDWDDDDEEDEALNDEERNRKIWEDANQRVPAPMQTPVINPNYSTRTPIHPSVFEPKMKILKRPQQSEPRSAPSTPAGPDGIESLQDREARYNAARERIFKDVVSKDDVKSDLPLSTDICAPKGPSGDNKGSAERPKPPAP